MSEKLNYYVNEHAVVDDDVEIGKELKSGTSLIYKVDQRSERNVYLDKM